MTNWKRNLVIVWIGQFFSIMGFSFSMSFVPYYMQELGVVDPVKLKAAIAVFTAAAPLAFAVFAPLWGAVADRYGRKLVLVRAYFGGALVLSLMGVVDKVEYLIFLRLLQGVLTGTMTASQKAL